jgi:hypothetical protein
VLQGPEDELEVSISNPISSAELSVHARLICEVDAGAAVKLLGAAGNDAEVLALAVFEYGEAPVRLDARTRK